MLLASPIAPDSNRAGAADHHNAAPPIPITAPTSSATAHGTPQGCALITGDGNPIRGQAQGGGGDGSPLGLQGAARFNAAGSDTSR